MRAHDARKTHGYSSRNTGRCTAWEVRLVRTDHSTSIRGREAQVRCSLGRHHPGREHEWHGVPFDTYTREALEAEASRIHECGFPSRETGLPCRLRVSGPGRCPHHRGLSQKLPKRQHR